MADPQGVPDLDRVKTWLGSGAQHVQTEDLKLMLASQIQKQRDKCTWPELEDDDGVPLDPVPTLPFELQEAILRRVARSAATKGLPLGVIVGGDEFQGAVTIRKWDVMIEDLEGYYEKAVFA